MHAGFHEGRGVHRADEVFWKADGAGFPGENRSCPLTVDGELTGIVVTFIDITERKPAATGPFNC